MEYIANGFKIITFITGVASTLDATFFVYILYFHPNGYMRSALQLQAVFRLLRLAFCVRRQVFGLPRELPQSCIVVAFNKQYLRIDIIKQLVVSGKQPVGLEFLTREYFYIRNFLLAVSHLHSPLAILDSIDFSSAVSIKAQCEGNGRSGWFVKYRSSDIEWIIRQCDNIY